MNWWKKMSALPIQWCVYLGSALWRVRTSIKPLINQSFQQQQQQSHKITTGAFFFQLIGECVASCQWALPGWEEMREWPNIHKLFRSHSPGHLCWACPPLWPDGAHAYTHTNVHTATHREKKKGRQIVSYRTCSTPPLPTYLPQTALKRNQGREAKTLGSTSQIKWAPVTPAEARRMKQSAHILRLNRYASVIRR